MEAQRGHLALEAANQSCARCAGVRCGPLLMPVWSQLEMKCAPGSQLWFSVCTSGTFILTKEGGKKIQTCISGSFLSLIFARWICSCLSLVCLSVGGPAEWVLCYRRCLQLSSFQDVWADGWPPDHTKERDLKEIKSVYNSLLDYQLILILFFFKPEPSTEPHPCVTTLWSNQKWMGRMWGDLPAFSACWYNDGCH